MCLQLSASENQGYHEKNQKDEEQDFCDADGSACNPAKTQHACDECDNQKNDSVVQHGNLLTLLNVESGDYFQYSCQTR